MSERLNRRRFLKKSVLLPTIAAAGLSLEEGALLAKTKRRPIIHVPEGSIKGMPLGKIHNIKISRLICGGNLINGYAHSRDLMYVSSLLKHYFTDEKILETLKLSEENGINTCIMNVASQSTEENTIMILNRFWKDEGGKLQWIAQCDSYEHDVLTNVKKAVDNGAVGAFIQGGCGDNLVKNGRLDLIEKFISFAKQNGLIAGVGSHSLLVPIAVEQESINPDFYFKTLNTVNYNCGDAEETAEFMKRVKKPWIAYKVLAAGVINPRKGFDFAFKNGADFINVGMYDFQIKEDIMIAKRAISNNKQRERSWCG